MEFLPFPILKTKRLVLRKISESDSNEMLFLRSDKRVNKYISRPPSEQTKTIDDALKFIKMLQEGLEGNKFIPWGISLNEDPTLIGTIGFHNFSTDRKRAEVGYDLHPSFHKKGIMCEALIEVIEFAFDQIELDLIEAFTHRENAESIALLEKNGFHFNPNRKSSKNDSDIVYQLHKVQKELY